MTLWFQERCNSINCFLITDTDVDMTMDNAPATWIWKNSQPALVEMRMDHQPIKLNKWYQFFGFFQFTKTFNFQYCWHLRRNTALSVLIVRFWNTLSTSIVNYTFKSLVGSMWKYLLQKTYDSPLPFPYFVTHLDWLYSRVQRVFLEQWIWIPTSCFIPSVRSRLERPSFQSSAGSESAPSQKDAILNTTFLCSVHQNREEIKTIDLHDKALLPR